MSSGGVLPVDERDTCLENESGNFKMSLRVAAVCKAIIEVDVPHTTLVLCPAMKAKTKCQETSLQAHCPLHGCVYSFPLITVFNVPLASNRFFITSMLSVNPSGLVI